MPRRARRALLDGYPVHVLQRGHNKATVFPSEADHGLYLGLLQEYSKKHSCAIHGYVLMTNHIHLLVSPPEIPALSRMMHSINQIYGQHLNRATNRCGSVWQGRFKSCLVDTTEYLLTCQRYIEDNPVRAGMVADPSLYPLSSYGVNAEGRPSHFLTPHPKYLALGNTDESRQAAYRSLFGRPITPEMLARIRTSIHRNMPLGDDDFVRRALMGDEPETAPVPHLSQVPVPYLSPV